MATIAQRVPDAERLRLCAHPGGFPVMRQIWRHLAFLHWPVAAEEVARLLPPGLDVDTFEGTAYVGIVPFTIAGTRPPLLPPAPGLSSFHELNLRTYVHRAGRDPGVWFFSLDATSRLTVAGARAAYALPYFYARIAVAVGAGPDPAVDYSSRRAVTGSAAPAVFAARYQPTGPAAPATPGTLEFFLAERYLLYAARRGRLRTARVFHPAYPLQPAIATDVTDTLTTAAGLPPTAGAPLVHYAREVDVRVYRPHTVAASG